MNEYVLALEKQLSDELKSNGYVASSGAHNVYMSVFSKALGELNDRIELLEKA